MDSRDTGKLTGNIWLASLCFQVAVAIRIRSQFPSLVDENSNDKFVGLTKYPTQEKPLLVRTGNQKFGIQHHTVLSGKDIKAPSTICIEWKIWKCKYICNEISRRK